MRRFRKRSNKNIIIDAAQYIGKARPEVPHKLLKKSFFLFRIFGASKWALSTRYGYMAINSGDFIIRYSDGKYDVYGHRTFTKVYERAS